MRTLRCAFVLLTIAPTLVIGGEARAACNNGNEQFFISARTTSGGEALRYGVYAKAMAYNNDLDLECYHDPDALFVHTVRMASLTACRQVEAGLYVTWGLQGTWDGDQSASKKDWYVFTEKQTACNGPDNADLYLSLTYKVIEVGTDDRFKISSELLGDGQTRWRLYADFLNGRGWFELDGSPFVTNYNSAIPMGESERFGENTRQRAFLHDLAFAGQDGTFYSWADNGCHSHWQSGLQPPHWEYDRAGADGFRINQSGSSICDLIF